MDVLGDLTQMGTGPTAARHAVPIGTVFAGELEDLDAHDHSFSRPRM
jgi:hypothetical protein